jgi:hypothetical protein
LEQARESNIAERLDKLSGGVLLTEYEVALLVKHPIGTLKHWRLNGKDKGPKPVQMPSASIRYRVADVRAWLAKLPAAP